MRSEDAIALVVGALAIALALAALFMPGIGHATPSPYKLESLEPKCASIMDVMDEIETFGQTPRVYTGEELQEFAYALSSTGGPDLPADELVIGLSPDIGAEAVSFYALVDGCVFLAIEFPADLYQILVGIIEELRNASPETQEGEAPSAPY